MSGDARPVWGIAIEGKPAPMLQIALGALCRNGSAPKTLPACNGEPCTWVRQVAECLKNGQCRVAVLFCQDAGLACCIANKVPGVRAAAVGSIAQANRALDQLGANLLVVEMLGRTYYEFKELLRLCHAGCRQPVRRAWQVCWRNWTAMRIAEVIGTVTLSRVHPTLTGARWVIGVPFSLRALREGRAPDGEDLVIYENLAAGVGSRIGFSEGGEAAAPFHPEKKPVDAYCACILDQLVVKPS